MTPSQHRFDNALRILLNVGREELPGLADHQWALFCNSPFAYFITASDAHKDAIWALIESRQPKHDHPKTHDPYGHVMCAAFPPGCDTIEACKAANECRKAHPARVAGYTPGAGATQGRPGHGASVDGVSVWERRVRHKKRGTTYTVIGTTELQMATDLVDGAFLTIYQSEDGKCWARQEDEFADGRLEEIPREAMK